MDPNNPLADREKALENEYIKKKEQQMAKDRAMHTKAAKDKSTQTEPAKGTQS
ncbi:uncharacterized protein BCR38DRAFT_444849 [Pseudomassariella vexata]|uniref:Uncharacterized protein n=1 Tax=Pseudomassariella vexata TaxID=1141098 RepID=A0A1Y2DJW5_9PEZI|nr:uncharacterized protein BCR38DRAFT_444849 [Pseudomassariella vexata]ORY59542.1 hypothetical protein BCR38DRAFT_444849 [Pseudomassariella vexata]